MEQPGKAPVPDVLVAASSAVALALVYSAPMPGVGSRYVDGRVAHESRMLSVVPVRDALADSGSRGVGEAVLDATLASLALANFADPRAAGHLAPLARAALLGEPSSRTLARLDHDDIAPFARALEAAGEEGPLAWLRYEQQAGEEQASLRVRSWPSGEDHLLARCHGHGASVDWAASS